MRKFELVQDSVAWLAVLSNGIRGSHLTAELYGSKTRLAGQTAKHSCRFLNLPKTAAHFAGLNTPVWTELHLFVQVRRLVCLDHSSSMSETYSTADI